MNILHLNHAKDWHGGERQTLLLAAALQRAGVRNTIACRAGSPLESCAGRAGIPILALPASILRATFSLGRAAAGFDLVHCHTARAHSQAALSALMHGKPVIVTRRVDVWPGRSGFNRLKYRTAAKVVCISRAIARQLEDWGVRPEKLTVIYSAVPMPDAEAARPEHRAALRMRLGIAPGQKLVGNIAHLLPHKDHATLLRAARLVVASHPGTKFTIIGNGPLWEGLLGLRRELELEEAVHFAGYLAQAEQYLPAFDVLAMSSSTEGLGSIVLDAFAAGVPVASTAGGGLPELVRDGETGLLAPAGDAAGLARVITRLLEDPGFARKLAARAAVWVRENCSVEKMAGAYLEVYREILSLRG